MVLVIDSLMLRIGKNRDVHAYCVQKGGLVDLLAATLEEDFHEGHKPVMSENTLLDPEILWLRAN